MKRGPSFFMRCWRWLLGRLLDLDEGRVVMSELQELYELRRTRDGDRAARRWLRRQLAQYPHQLLLERFRRSRPPSRDEDGNHTEGGAEPVHNLVRDLRHGLRSLVRTPVLTATIVLTVGLGIGATTTIVSVVNAVLLSPLPYADPDRLVTIYTDSPPNRWPFSVADYRALDEQQASFALVAGYGNRTMTFNRDDVAERVQGKNVTWTYFPLLGLTPLHGRLFDENDGEPNGEPVVVVSHGFWTRHLGADANVIGDTVRLDGTDHTVVGVLGRDVGPFEQDRDCFIAVQWQPPPRKGPFFITALGRLAPGVTPAAAAQEMRAINERLFPMWASSYQDQRASWGVMDLKERVVGDAATPLAIVLVAVGFVLLLACTNAANLLIGRVTHRRRELAVRAALGASRGRLLRHLLSESTLLALGGAALGLVVAVGGIRLVASLGGEFLPRTQEISLDGVTGTFLVLVTVASALLFGLVPASQGARTGSVTGFDDALRSSGRGGGESRGARRLRRVLVAIEFAIAVPLLIGAGLLIASLSRLSRVDPGFDTHNVVTAAVSLPATAYPDAADALAFWEQWLARLRALPGVEGGALADGRPPAQINMTNNFDLLDRPTPPNESQPATPWVAVTPGYFELLRVPLLEGRLFDERERDGSRPGAQPVAVVDEAWARRFYPNETAVGRRFYSGGSRDPANVFTVIGVVGNVKQMGLDASDDGTVYWPSGFSSSRFRFVILRTAADPSSVLSSVRGSLRELDSTLPLSQVATIDELMADSLDAPRYLTLLVTAFGAVAWLLSIVGIYGVMSYFVQQHTKDIGIRLALGGGPSTVSRMVVARGMLLVGAGVAVGTAGAFYLTRFLSSVLFQVSPMDAMTFAGVPVLMLAVALLACFLPARRAAGLDPATILRQE